MPDPEMVAAAAVAVEATLPLLVVVFSPQAPKLQGEAATGERISYHRPLLSLQMI